jgi:peptidoglycan/LPS O-acetylase OafA/YrhL
MVHSKTTYTDINQIQQTNSNPLQTEGDFFMKKISQNLYYPNLNGLRFFGAFLVLISHVEYLKECFGLPNLYSDYRFALLGKLGVHLFFVLSGFLITSLLFNEQEQQKKINIKQFYLRRIIKIWPLYFAIVLLGFFILPHLGLFEVPTLTEHVQENFTNKLIYNITFLPNVAIVLYPFMPLSFQLWSIGLEEQYYLIIPWVIAKLKSRIFFFIIAIVAYLFIKEYIAVAYSKNIQSSYWYKLHYFWYYFHVDSLAIGSLAALINFRYPKFVKTYILNRVVEISSIVLLIVLYIKLSHVYYYYQDEVYDFFFAIIIMNAALHEKTILKLENKVLNYLGKISYSTYMVHVIMLVLSFNILKHLNSMSNINIYLLSLLLTYLASIVTYEYFESKILALKKKL